MKLRVDRAEAEGRNRRPAWHRGVAHLVDLLGVRRMADRLTGLDPIQWGRVIQQQEIQSWLDTLPAEELEVLEISGDEWRDARPWHSHRMECFPAFDVCDQPLSTRFDLIIADQVFEHLARPYRAAGNVLSMLKPGGRFLISTPFLVRVHRFPIDCTRWTEDGLRNFLGEAGFPLEGITTGSWGNRACVKANFTRWTSYRSRLHSLRDEPDFPVHVWAMATCPTAPKSEEERSP
ncbi:MAG: methyltransferase domain-containing protein [Phycisphaerales bacterium]|nr:methyltransferase domain-containing protein [Phycisphaerales bacterium]